MQSFDTREEWMAAAVDRMRPLFALHGATIPSNVKVSCGFPFGRRGITSLDAIGQAWPAVLSRGNHIELFVSPVLDDGARVADVLAHECVHAAVGNEHGHGPVFRKLAEAIGLTGKMTATVAGDTFKAWWGATGIGLGVYPHARLNVLIERTAPKGKPSGPVTPRDPTGRGGIVYRPDTTRQIKVQCPRCAEAGEPYIVRMSRTTFNRGAPICPIHNHTMEA
ncbi:MAG TPA: SprT-like domain-containing protein [Reyranella sp.]|nr:SprT-like domain-containing protein [Reyranella sp.]